MSALRTGGEQTLIKVNNQKSSLSILIYREHIQQIFE